MYINYTLDVLRYVIVNRLYTHKTRVRKSNFVNANGNEQNNNEIKGPNIIDKWKVRK